MKFEWLVALRYLRSRRKERFIALNSLFSMIGVAVGVMALIVVISVMGGFENHLRTKILGVNSHIVVRSYGGAIPAWRAVQEKILSINGGEGRQGWKRLLPGGGPAISAITPFIFVQALVSAGNAVSGALIRGIDPATIGTVIETGEVVAGGGVEALAMKRRPPGIVLGKEIARTLGVAVGQVVSIVLPGGTVTPVGMMPKIRPFKVVGIVTTGMYEYDSSLAFISLADAQRLLSLQGKVHGFELKVSDIYAADELAAEIQERLGYPYWAMDWQRMSRSLFSALKLEKLAMFIVLTLIVLVAAFNIISSLTMLVMDKRQDIAVLKAMGATDGQILRIFVYAGTAIGLVGTAAGTAGGIVLCELLSRYKFIKIPQEVYYTDTLPIQLVPWWVVVIAVSAVLICFCATIYPARKAAAINPSQALRTG